MIMTVPVQSAKREVYTAERRSSPSTQTLWNLFLYSMSFRLGMQVTEVMVVPSGLYGETGYYVCPRCSITMEREFMAYCDRCGQRLDWKHYKKAKVIYPGKPNTES